MKLIKIWMIWMVMMSVYEHTHSLWYGGKIKTWLSDVQPGQVLFLKLHTFTPIEAYAQVQLKLDIGPFLHNLSKIFATIDRIPDVLNDSLISENSTDIEILLLQQIAEFYAELKIIKSDFKPDNPDFIFHRNMRTKRSSLWSEK